MSDEQNNTTQQTTEPAEPAVTRDQVVNSKWFQGVTSESAKVKAELAELKDMLAKKAEDEQRKELEAKGQYETIIQQRDAQIAELTAKHAAQMTRMQLTSELTRNGLVNQLALDGAVASYSGDAEGIGEYVQILMKEHSSLFQAPGMPPADNPAQGSRSSGGSSTRWDQVKQKIENGTPAEATQANDAVRRYMLGHGGAMPPGFSS